MSAKTNVVVISVIVLVVVAIVVSLLYTNTRESFVRNEDLDMIVMQLREAFPVVEKLNFYEGDKSYTINKQDVYICMRDENGGYYDRNFLVYVVLHEISHALCDEVGHTQKFLDIFQQVVDHAAKLGVYDPRGRKIQNYCNYRK
jgi:hypothetical protein